MKKIEARIDGLVRAMAGGIVGGFSSYVLFSNNSVKDYNLENSGVITGLGILGIYSSFVVAGGIYDALT